MPIRGQQAPVAQQQSFLSNKNRSNGYAGSEALYTQQPDHSELEAATAEAARPVAARPSPGRSAFETEPAGWKRISSLQQKVKAPSTLRSRQDLYLCKLIAHRSPRDRTDWQTNTLFAWLRCNSVFRMDFKKDCIDGRYH